MNKLTEVQAAYLAGLVDGEGCIGMYQDHGSPKYAYPRLDIVNTDEFMIQWIKKTVGEGAITLRKRKASWKLAYAITYRSEKAFQILQQVVPYLVTKKDRADIVLDIWQMTEEAKEKAGGEFYSHNPVPECLKDARVKAFSQIKELNKRGVN